MNGEIKKINKEIKQTVKSLVISAFILALAVVFMPDGKSEEVWAFAAQMNKAYENSFHLEELSEPINLTNAYPVTDEMGMKGTAYVFKITNNSQTKKTLEIAFKANDVNTLPIDNLKYHMTEDDEVVVDRQVMEVDILHTIELDGKTSKVYTLKLWIKDSATNDIMGTRLSRNLEINEL